MNRKEWEIACGFCLEAHGPFNFSALEICDVGRIHGTAVLQAPPAELLQHALKLLPVLEWIRWWGGPAPVRVNSWYRDPEYNAAVGGAENSMHLTCGAADISKDGWDPRDLAMALDANHSATRKLGIGVYPTFVHVDIRGFIGRKAPARWGEWGRAA